MAKFRIHVIVLLFAAGTACGRSGRLEELKPGLGDIMGRVQQHHAKLYFAGAHGNWKLAEYELGEIREGLDDAARFHPTFKSVKEPIDELILTFGRTPLAAMERAIVAQRKSEFEAAFAAVNNGCNKCHEAAERSFIVIQNPTGPMFSNQRF